MGGLVGHVACQRASPTLAPRWAAPPRLPAASLRLPFPSLSFSERDLETGVAVDVRADSSGLWGSAPRPQVCEGVIVDPPAQGGVPLHNHRCRHGRAQVPPAHLPPTQSSDSERSVFGPLSVGGSPSPGGPCPGRMGRK